MTNNLQTTPLYDACCKAGGRMVDFHGWLLPVQFQSIIAEHKAVRESAGMFDVSHMGQIWVEGKDAYPFVQYITCNNIKKDLFAGTYTHMLTPQGTIIDDMIAFCLDAEKFLIVVNAACRQEDFAWMQKQAPRFNVTVTDASDQYGMIALQGPKALEKLETLLPGISALARFHIQKVQLFGEEGYVTRTGYTGEDGAEIMLSPVAIVKLWNALLAAGVTPCGLGARDVLRLEAGYLLNGQDADQTRTPYEAACGWVVKLSKEDFIGKPALEKQKAQGLAQKLTAFELKGAGVPRHGCKIFYEGKEIGFVTSGTFSPLFKGIAVGYAQAGLTPGAQVEIEIHGRRIPAAVTKTPFYKNRV